MLTLTDAASWLKSQHNIVLKPNSLLRYVRDSGLHYTPKLPARKYGNTYLITQTNLINWAKAYLAKRAE
jgi:hypothetical protein